MIYALQTEQCRERLCSASIRSVTWLLWVEDAVENEGPVRGWEPSTWYFIYGCYVLMYAAKSLIYWLSCFQSFAGLTILSDWLRSRYKDHLSRDLRWMWSPQLSRLADDTLTCHITDWYALRSHNLALVTKKVDHTTFLNFSSSLRTNNPSRWSCMVVRKNWTQRRFFMSINNDQTEVKWPQSVQPLLLCIWAVFGRPLLLAGIPLLPSQRLSVSHSHSCATCVFNICLYTLL